MAFDRIRLFQFRNLQDGTIELPSSQVFLLGENGQGKSNFLESMYLLSYGGSFRTRRDSEMCRNGTDELAVDGTISREGENHTVKIRFQDGRKRIFLDDSPLQDRRDMVSVTPTVIFRHDDMAFVQGAPEMQRWFIDQTLSMYQPRYIDDLRRYRLILKNRNHALKNEQFNLLEIYDEELAETGLHLQRERLSALEAFNSVFAEDFVAISGLSEPLQLLFRPSWREMSTVGEVVKSLQARREQERSLRTTTSGPHRDRILFRFEGRDFLQIASTGQIRLVALILRVAQARFYALQSNHLPVLLLDDVLLELDPRRRSLFVERLPPSEQRIFTFLPGEPFDAYRNATTLVYSVDNGRLQRA